MTLFGTIVRSRAPGRLSPRESGLRVDRRGRFRRVLRCHRQPTAARRGRFRPVLRFVTYCHRQPAAARRGRFRPVLRFVTYCRRQPTSARRGCFRPVLRFLHYYPTLSGIWKRSRSVLCARPAANRQRGNHRNQSKPKSPHIRLHGPALISSDKAQTSQRTGSRSFLRAMWETSHSNLPEPGKNARARLLDGITDGIAWMQMMKVKNPRSK
jgi:hypothetical protein